MKQPSDQLKLGAILSYVSTGLNMAVQLLYTPLMIRLLGQSEYGLYTLVGSVVSYLSLFSLGFTGAYLRFYSQRRAKNDEEGIARLNGMFLTVFCVMSLAALVCGMVLLRFPRALFGNKLTAREVGTARILMAVLVVNIALTFPAGLLESMDAGKRPVQSAAVSAPAAHGLRLRGGCRRYHVFDRCQAGGKRLVLRQKAPCPIPV